MPGCAVMCISINTHTHTHTHAHTYTQHGEEDTPMLGHADARRLDRKYVERTDIIPLR